MTSSPVPLTPRAAKSVRRSQDGVYLDKKHGIRNSYKTFGLLQLGYDLFSSITIIINSSFSLTHLINSLTSLPFFRARSS